METQKILGERLRALRIEKGKKQRELAELLGMTLRNYQRFEHGDIDIPSSTLRLFADYYDVPADYLLGRTDDRKNRRGSA